MTQEAGTDFQWHCRPWSAIDCETLYALLKVRSAVFVVEQDCVYQDLDGKDRLALHCWLERKDQPASEGGPVLAYTRLLPAGVSYPGEVSIGRVVTASEVRRGGWGKALMKRSLDEVHAAWPDVPIRISAQSYLEAFYSGFGFVVEGPSYLEDGIPHVAMTRPPGPA